jgi:16S rRNA (cytosine967-C5)-methyltransferase
MTPEIFEDLVRGFDRWKKHPRPLVRLHEQLTSLSPSHGRLAQEVFFWLHAVLRKWIPMDWWLERHLRKSPPPFARSAVEVLGAKFLTSHTLSSYEFNLGMELLKRHFPAPIHKWAYRVLQTLVRQGVEELKEAPEAVQLGLPEWIFRRLQKRYSSRGADFKGLIQQKLTPRPVSLRVDPSRLTREEAFRHFHEVMEVEMGPHPSNPYGWYVHQPGRPLHEMALFKDGRVSIQSEASVVVGWMVHSAMKGKGALLDLTAAPGGKVLWLFQLNPSLTCVANCRDAEALERTANNLARDLRANIPLWVHDLALESPPISPQRFDWVLCDVPCSNLGTVFSKPDVSFLHRESDMESLAVLQRKCLEHAWTLLHPGGTLVYVTCSQEPEETEDVIRDFRRAHPNSGLVKVPEVCAGILQRPEGSWLDLFHFPDWDGYAISMVQKQA